MKSHLQNGKERKLTYNYFFINEANKRMSEIINGIKKEEITSYLDTSSKKLDYQREKKGNLH